MRVVTHQAENFIRYDVEQDPEDPASFQTHFSDRELHWVGGSYTVQLPPAWNGKLHPDVHALAVWVALRPFIGERLTLDFAVSPAFAELMHEAHGTAFTRVDASILPRQRPDKGAAALLYSGGYDSTAATLVLPRRVAVTHLSRVLQGEVEGHSSQHNAAFQVDRQLALCERAGRDGRPVHVLKEDHEFLWRPYPAWHSSQEHALMASLYLADSIDLAVIESGFILENFHDTAYRTGTSESWQMASMDDGDRDGGVESDPFRGEAARTGPGGTFSLGALGELETVGLRRAGSLGGVTTVGTAIMVHRGASKGLACPCDFNQGSDSPDWPATDRACMVCERCFQKGLLGDIVMGRKTDPAFVEHYLSIPGVYEHFRRPFFDWYHIWLYIFQRVNCEHWLMKELRRQALQGPDLSWLERWYPGNRHLAEPSYRGEVEEALAEYLEPMTEADIVAMGDMNLPELDIPTRKRFYNGLHRYPEPPSFQQRRGNLQMTFSDTKGELAEIVFLVGSVESQDRVFAK